MRSISMSMPSRVFKMTLWGGTEDEEKFIIHSLKRGTPYVKAYGVRYDLTAEETQYVKNMIKLFERGV